MPGQEIGKAFWCGWIEDASVLAVWDLVTTRRRDWPWTLVTMLDSNERVAELAAVTRLRSEHKDEVVPVGHAALLDSDCFATLRVHDDNFFTGFDEIWATPGRPPVPKPRGMRITSEVALTDFPVPGLGRWMQEAGLKLGLGDGFGVNVATFDSPTVGILTDAYGDAVHVADQDASW